MPRKRAFLLVFLLTGCMLLVAEEGGSPLSAGTEAFSAGRYQEALDRFGAILADPSASAFRAEASYWSILSYIGLGDGAAASKAIDSYLTAYPDGARVPDLLYQRGRLLYAKGDYDAALGSFSSFVSLAPSHSLVPSALYWGGECLYSLGKLEEADKVFQSLIEGYPSSVKIEAATYKRQLIGLEFRERELLKLLTWSHEESLRAADDFRSRERKYEDSLDAYQRQLAQAKAQSGTKVVDNPQQQARIEELQAKLAAAQSDLDASRAALARAQAQSASTASASVAPVVASPQAQANGELLVAALDAKKRALDLLAFYLEHLSQGAAK
jgi:TolA-binding protein